MSDLTIKPTKHLTIEINTSCSLRCPGCPASIPRQKVHPENNIIGRGSLNIADLRRLLDKNKQISLIDISSRGEPLLAPDLRDIIDLATARGIDLRCDSGTTLNGIYDPSVIPALVSSGFLSLTCAIDGATKDVYEKYRAGGSIEKALSFISQINALKTFYNTRLPVLTWQYIVFGHNEHEIAKARKMAEERGMIFTTKMAWDSTYSPIRDRALVARETGWEYLTREEYLAGTGRDYIRSVCYSLWRSPRVNWNGDILGCCWNDWKTFGANAFHDGYIPAINNERLSLAKRMLLGEIGPVDEVPCATCPMYRSLRDTGNYLTEKEALGIRSLPYRALRYVYDRSPALITLRRALYDKTGI